MTAYDFLMICLGVSVLMVSIASAYRLIDSRPASKRIVPDEPQPDRKKGLARRLEDIQSQRYAPIRVPTPGEPGGPRVVPPVRVLQPRTRPFSVPRQPPTVTKKPKGDTVVPFPVKDPKDDTPKKE